jgi:hypothetical protein
MKKIPHIKLHEGLAAIISAWKVQRHKIFTFVKTGYSFEEWLNWEAYAACKRHKLKTEPKPSYRTAEVTKSNEQADLCFALGDGEFAFVEVGLVHDGTMTKWLAKLQHDRFKLSQIKSKKYHGVQLIVLACRDQEIFSWWQKKISILYSKPSVFPPDSFGNKKFHGHIYAWVI